MALQPQHEYLQIMFEQTKGMKKSLHLNKEDNHLGAIVCALLKALGVLFFGDRSCLFTV